MELILKYFPDLSSTQITQFNALGDLYKDWNSKINVISRKDMDHFYERHVLHSLGIAKVKQFSNATKVLDVGTGGGFPGIPLAILFPQSEFLLIDSIGKKIKVVQEVTNALKLANVNASQIRAEEVPEKFDFVVSRAVTRLQPFYSWINNKILKSGPGQETGILYLKGGDLEEELSELKAKKEVLDLSKYFEEDFFETKKVVYVPF